MTWNSLRDKKITAIVKRTKMYGGETRACVNFYLDGDFWNMAEFALQEDDYWGEIKEKDGTEYDFNIYEDDDMQFCAIYRLEQNGDVFYTTSEFIDVEIISDSCVDESAEMEDDLNCFFI